jgi:hypothetical protein
MRVFEQFLKERKKRRKVKSQETLQYYKSLFMRYLEGKELSEQLIDYVVNHENKWLRNVFRHYIQYLYHRMWLEVCVMLSEELLKLQQVFNCFSKQPFIYLHNVLISATATTNASTSFHFTKLTQEHLYLSAIGL